MGIHRLNRQYKTPPNISVIGYILGAELNPSYAVEHVNMCFQAQCPYMVRLLHHYETPNHRIFLLLEYVRRGRLLDFVRSKREQWSRLREAASNPPPSSSLLKETAPPSGSSLLKEEASRPSPSGSEVTPPPSSSVPSSAAGDTEVCCC